MAKGSLKIFFLSSREYKHERFMTNENLITTLNKFALCSLSCWSSLVMSSCALWIFPAFVLSSAVLFSKLLFAWRGSFLIRELCACARASCRYGVSTSGASDWQACEDSQWNKGTTLVFHKIVIYNPWTWKQSEDAFKVSLTPKQIFLAPISSEFLKNNFLFSF